MRANIGTCLLWGLKSSLNDMSLETLALIFKHHHYMYFLASLMLLKSVVLLHDIYVEIQKKKKKKLFKEKIEKRKSRISHYEFS